DTRFHCYEAIFDSELKKCFEMVRGECNRHDEHILDAFCRQVFDRVRRRRRRPFHGSDFRLVAKAVVLQKTALPDNRVDRYLDMPGIWIALTDKFHRRTVRAEKYVYTRADFRRKSL